MKDKETCCSCDIECDIEDFKRQLLKQQGKAPDIESQMRGIIDDLQAEILTRLDGIRQFNASKCWKDSRSKLPSGKSSAGDINPREARINRIAGDITTEISGAVNSAMAKIGGLRAQADEHWNYEVSYQTLNEFRDYMNAKAKTS